jgi:hypothetical protein
MVQEQVYSKFTDRLGPSRQSMRGTFSDPKRGGKHGFDPALRIRGSYNSALRDRPMGGLLAYHRS